MCSPRRKKQTLTDGNYLDYTYDGLSQLQSATGKESGGTTRLHEKFGYAYDPAGNLSKRTNNALIQTFNANNLNQLTTVNRSGTLTAAGTTTEAATSVMVNASAATLYSDDTFARAGISLVDGNNTITAVASDSLGRSDTNSITVKLPATVTFNHDVKGNLTNDGRLILTYDDENQLVAVIVTNSATDSTRSEFVYDGLFRRRIRREFKWQGGTLVPTEEVRYVYDGRLPIQERSGSNIPLVTYTRGNDLWSLRGQSHILILLTRIPCLGMVRRVARSCGRARRKKRNGWRGRDCGSWDGWRQNWRSGRRATRRRSSWRSSCGGRPR